MKRFIFALFLVLTAGAHATVSNQTTSVSYTCTGSVGPFSFVFPISDPTALTVTQNGLILNTGVYTITPVNKNYTYGGSIKLKTACPNGQTLVLTRITPLTQATVFANNMPNPMPSIMYGLDKLTMIEQEQQKLIANPTAANINGHPITPSIINNVIAPIPGTGTITAALTTLAGTGGMIQLQCGTYTDNLNITFSDIIIQGSGVNCTVLQPAANLPMLKIDATGGAIQYIQIRDLTMQNTGGFTSDGIQITGPANQINDWHYFENLNIQAFQNGINLIGRTIWTTFSNVHVGASLNNGINASTAAVLNHIVFRDGQINNSFNYGVYWNNTNVNASLSTEFDHVNVENSGLSGVLANCAGMYITGVGTMSIHDGYFEANCGTVPDALGADIRVTGTYAQALDIKSNLIWSATNYGILNDTIQTTGEYTGNKFANESVDAVKIQTTHALSNIHIGPNFMGGAVALVPDGGGKTHTTLDGNYAIAQTFQGDLNVPNLTASGTLTGFTVNYTNFLQRNGVTISPAITTGTPTVGQAACIKSAGPPVTIGYCSTVVSAGGACTCN